LSGFHATHSRLEKPCQKADDAGEPGQLHHKY
jgi:hypothetical protein